MFDITKFDFSEDDLLVVTDMQVDFKDGPLGTERAREITPGIACLVKAFPGTKVFTQDTHGKDYLRTQEGRNLPVVHTVKDTPGWKIVPELVAVMSPDDVVIEKPGFGSLTLSEFIRTHKFRRIWFVGVCTGICVLSNVVIAKAADTEAVVCVIADLCGCVSKESHETALSAMRLLQVQVV